MSRVWLRCRRIAILGHFVIVPRMISALSALAGRGRIVLTNWLIRLGFREDTFIVLLAFVVGIITAAAAVGFHELIDHIRRFLFGYLGPQVDLYGKGIVLLIAIPAIGGLAVGVISNHIVRAREGHGIIDVMESVTRSSGVIHPGVALEKIVTSAITIGSGGSAGAEGPIVQIGAAIASGIGQFFHVARQHMPVLIGCGTAAGISAIFNAPIGGVLFTLEVIMRDFSIRTFTPIVIASVIANFTTQSIFRSYIGHEYHAIFQLPSVLPLNFQLGQVGNFIGLGLLCGIVGVLVIRLMHRTEDVFAHIKLPAAIKPAVGGALLGISGVIYVVWFGWFVLGTDKPIPFSDYAMPAFFGDGYGAVKPMLSPDFFSQWSWAFTLSLIGFLCVAKILGTCLSLGSGGAGGVIAPSLFLGAVAGAAMGLVLEPLGLNQGLEPHVYALVGMGAVLGAVVHAPLASILILVEVTRDYQVTVPAMLTCIVATSTAQILFKDSIYTLSLRKRGVRLGNSADLTLLQRLSVEQVPLEPATVLRTGDPFQKAVDLTSLTGATDFAVVDAKGLYAGMVTANDLQSALIDREAVPLLLVSEVMRTDIPVVKNTDSLATVMDTFSRLEISRLPVAISSNSGKVIGLISRAALMRRYQQGLAES